MTATPPDSETATAWVDGQPATFDAAVAEAARLIGASFAPLFAHLGADVEGAREAILLAEHVGAVLDHAFSGDLIKNLDPIRETGGFETTTLEAQTRADIVLWVGSQAAAPDWLTRPASNKAPNRQIVFLNVAAEQRLPMLAAMRACIKRRPFAKAWAAAGKISSRLGQANFGVAMWSAGELAPLDVEAIHGLVRDLNETTRFSTLATPAPDNGNGVQTVAGWMTGFPLRTGFARGFPEHDPWRYDAKRLVAAGEVDCQIWISSLEGGASPPGAVDVALCAPDVAGQARVRIDVARPGVEHDAILYDPSVGGLVAQATSTRTKTPSVAAALWAMRKLLGAPSC